MAREMGFAEVPVVYVNIPDLEKEKELNLRLNKNTGEFDLELLAEFDESLLKDVGFTSEDLDDIFPTEENAEVFDADHELKKIGIDGVTVQPGDVYELNGSRLMCGDSMETEHVLKLMGGEKADMCFTDPPYILDYLKGKRRDDCFGLKRNRRYIDTDTLPDDFTERWMANIASVQGCGRTRDKQCKGNKYLREEELVNQLLGILDQIDMSDLGVQIKFEQELKRHNRFQRTVLRLSDPKAKHIDVDARTYAKYILKEGTNEEKRELMGCFKSKIRITKGIVTVEP